MKRTRLLATAAVMVGATVSSMPFGAGAGAGTLEATALAARPVQVTSGLARNYVGFAARLTDATGAPLAGQTVTFTVEGPAGFPCVGITDGNGVAACSVNLVGAALMAASSSYTAVFGGTAQYAPSSAKAPITDN